MRPRAARGFWVLGIVGLALLLVAVACGGGGATKGAAQQPTQASPATPAKEQPGDQVSASGKLASVNIVAGTVTIAAQDGGELVLNLTPSSKIFVGDTSATAGSLIVRQGRQVTVDYKADNKTIVTLRVQE